MTQTKVEAPFVENNRQFRNLIINGDFKTWQRATAATAFSSGAYTTADRWKNLISTDGVLKSERHAMSLADQATTGQAYAYKVTCTSADTSIAAGQYALIHQPIEAQNLQHLKYGTSSAETLTLSFWAKATTQESTASDAKFSVTLNKPDSTAYFCTKEYSFDAHDTWKKFEITFTPTEGTTTLITNSGGAIVNDNGVGLHLYFAFGNGSNFTGTANTWTADSDYASTNQHNLLVNTSNNWFVTGVQLEVGDAATDFEHLPVDVQLARCHRYYYLLTQPQTGNNEPMGTGIYYSSSQVNCHIPTKVPMRTSPSIVCTDASNHFIVFRNSASDPVDNWSMGESTENTVELYNPADVSGTAGHGCTLSTNNSSAKLAFDAEL